MALDLAALGPADPFEDRYPAARPMPPAATEVAHRYRPWPAALPRLWTPYATANDQVTLGAATFGADPLLRHIWVADLHYGFDAKRPSFRAAYQYDRLVPTVTLTVEDTTDAARIRVRELVLGASLPVTRSLRSAQSLALAWHRKRETVLDTARPPFDLGGVQASWSFGNATIIQNGVAHATLFPPRPDRWRRALPAVHREVARWLCHQAVLWWITTNRFMELCSLRI